MRKTLSIMAMSTLLTLGLSNNALAADSSGEKSGAFVGVHGGVSLFGIGVYVDNKALDDQGYQMVRIDKANIATFNVGLNVGYQYFFIPIVGIRGYLGYDFNGNRLFFSETPTDQELHTSFQNITFNVDALINFLNTGNFTLGAYVGFGLGYGITGLTGSKSGIDEFKSQQYNGFNIPINVGIAATFASSHKVEIGAKIQTLAAGYNIKERIGTIEFLMNTHVINVGYSYIF
ncbi:outer membrane beta-barrel protein [Helicobacter trogontum]|uniref:Outer membrane beta-barrel protein n=1 Tax=Helicobacter trogontum TaxID=50960 RepID=A0A4V6HZJ3_9HELI|nr:outer membrane beta-barrel protein [Helicobacter trogontum]TLD84732.1 outer membrane beta-barrel protein [Helicobacter trogontum]